MNSAETSSAERQPTEKVSILLADDHPLFRKALQDIINEQPDLAVVAEAENGEDAIRITLETVPDIVVMDISMPILNGLEATKEIKSQCPTVAVLVLTIHNDIEHILSILDAGAVGYLTKEASTEEIVAAIRSVIAGESVIARPVLQQVLRHTMRYSVKPLAQERDIKLTVRESEVLKMAAKGLSNKEISLKMNLSLSTVKSYMVDTFSKLGVCSRTEAVITALRMGLITHDDINR